MSEELELTVAKALEIFEERQAEKEKKEKELEDARTEGYEAGKADKEAEIKAWKEEKASISVKKETELGSGGSPEGGPMAAFRHWAKTGDDLAARRELAQEDMSGGNPTDGGSAKALQEGTGSEGGFLVPNDFVNDIVELRDAASFPRLAGVRIVRTNRDVIDIPAESTKLANFTRTAEEAAFTSDDGAYAQNQVTVEKWTKVTMVSEEMLADEAAGWEQFYQDAVGRAWAATEAQYVATGSGTNQHTGIFVGGDTDAVTFNTDGGADSDGVMNADAPGLLFYTLGQGYRRDAFWLASERTQRLLALLKHTQANPGFAFAGADIMSIRESDGQVMLYGKPFYTESNVSEKANGIGFLAIGSAPYYALVERQGLVMKRNPYSRMSNGQIQFISQFRQGGTVLAEEAFVIAQGTSTA